jgi:hypothetical protein
VRFEAANEVGKVRWQVANDECDGLDPKNRGAGKLHAQVGFGWWLS